MMLIFLAKEKSLSIVGVVIAVIFSVIARYIVEVGSYWYFVS